MKTLTRFWLFLAVAGSLARGSAEGAEPLRVGAEGERILIVADSAGGLAGAAGGLIQEALELDVPVMVCLAAGGEAEMLAAEDALAALGCPAEAMECLGQPGGKLDMLWAERWGGQAPLRHGGGWGTTSVPYEWAWRPGAAHAGEDVVETLGEVVQIFEPTRILAAGTGPFAWEAARAAGCGAEVLEAVGGRYGGTGELAFPVAEFQMEPKRAALRAAGEAGVAKKREEWRKLDARAGGEELDGAGRIAGWRVERTAEGAVAFRAECAEKLGGRWAVRWRIWTTGGETPFAQQAKIVAEARRGNAFGKDLRTGKSVKATCLGWGGTTEVVTLPEAALDGATQAWVQLELMEGDEVLDRTGWVRVDWARQVKEEDDDGSKPMVWDGGNGKGLKPKVRMPGRPSGGVGARVLTPIAAPAVVPEAPKAEVPKAEAPAKTKAPKAEAPAKAKAGGAKRAKTDWDASVKW